MMRHHTLALQSQYRLLVLLIVYTVPSLWILAPATVEGGLRHTSLAVRESVMPRVSPERSGPELAIPNPEGAALTIFTQVQPLPWEEEHASDVAVHSSVLCLCFEKAHGTIRELHRHAARQFQEGMLALQAHRYAEAIDAYTKAIQLAPRNARAYTNRGIAYGRAGQYQLAYTDFTRALDLEPQQTTARTALGVMQFLLKSSPSND